jgi:hypothetical protein
VEEDEDKQYKDIDSSVETPAPEPQHLTRRERRKRKKIIILVAGAIVLLLLILGGLYWFFLRDGGDKTANQAASQDQDQSQEPAAPPPADPTPVAYKSTKLNIELTHRKDWSLKETANGEVTVTSPQIPYSRSDGQATTGVFTVKVRKGVPDAMKATIDKAVAPRKSEVIAYTAPTDQQRQYTNLSYAGQKDVFNFFIVTGNTEFKTGGAYAFALPIDGEFYLIAGGYGTDKDGTLSFDSVPAASMDSEALTQGIDIVKSLKIF